LKEYYPNIVSEYMGHLTEVVVCSKTPAASAMGNEAIFSSDIDLSSKQGGWNFNDQKILVDSLSGKKYFGFQSSDEFGMEFKVSLQDLVKTGNEILNVSASAFMNDTSAAPLLVMSMESADKTLDWRGVKFSDFLTPGKRGNVYLSVRFSDVRISTKNTFLKVYVWNKDHSVFDLYDLQVISEKGNPYFYGLIEKF